MPLYQEWSPNDHALAAIWHIEEPEAFFSDKTGINPAIKHPKKRIEHLCGRYLLQHLKEDFPLHHIAPDVHDKPRLPENQYFFSISHSYPYVAAIISDLEDCGIDIQIWKDNIAEIAHMYLSEEEQKICSVPPLRLGRGAGGEVDARLLTLAWTIKEAAYKWWGRRGAEFIRDLPIDQIEEESGVYQPQVPQSFQVKMQCYGHSISPEALLHKDFALSYISTQRPEANE